MSSIPFPTWLNRAANGICAEGFTAIHDGAAEFRRMPRQWGVADNHVLLMDLHEAAGRKSQSDRSCDRQPVDQDDRVRWPRGYAAEKMIKGRKRHILTDTIGRRVRMIVHDCPSSQRAGS
jgi:hypothetical protein